MAEDKHDLEIGYNALGREAGTAVGQPHSPPPAYCLLRVDPGNKDFGTKGQKRPNAQA